MKKIQLRKSGANTQQRRYTYTLAGLLLPPLAPGLLGRATGADADESMESAEGLAVFAAAASLSTIGLAVEGMR